MLIFIFAELFVYFNSFWTVPTNCFCITFHTAEGGAIGCFFHINKQMFFDRQSFENFPVCNYENLVLVIKWKWEGWSGREKRKEERGGEERREEINSKEFVQYFLGNCFPFMRAEFLRGRDKNNTWASCIWFKDEQACKALGSLRKVASLPYREYLQCTFSYWRAGKSFVLFFFFFQVLNILIMAGSSSGWLFLSDSSQTMLKGNFSKVFYLLGFCCWRGVQCGDFCLFIYVLPLHGM